MMLVRHRIIIKNYNKLLIMETAENGIEPLTCILTGCRYYLLSYSTFHCIRRISNSNPNALGILTTNL